MAAITYWVDGVAGNDANDGKSYANRLQTVSQLTTNITADGDGNDYTINILNTGTYTLDSNSLNVEIDNQPNSTFHFRGVSDSNETPALVNIQSHNSTAGGMFVYIHECTSVLFEYFHVDFTTSNDTNAHYLAWLREDCENAQARYCYFKAGTFGSATVNSVNDAVFNRVSFSLVEDLGEISYCVFENMRGNIAQTVSGSSHVIYSFHHNVIIADHEQTCQAWVGPSFSSASNDLRFYNNTYYAKTTKTTGTSYIGNGVFDTSATSGSHGLFHLYNNVAWIDENATTISVGQFIGGSAVGTVTNTVEQVGYNHFFTGPNTNDVGNISNYLGTPWDNEPYTGDVRADNVADTTIFADPSTTYAWTPTGSAVALTVPMDLRLLTYTTGGLGGSTPGAMGAAVTDYTATLTTSAANPKVGETVTLTATLSNVGSLSTNVVATMSFAGVTISGTPTASQGTFDTGTGIWSIGTLADSASATLTVDVTVNAGQEGNALVQAFAFTSGDIGSGGDTSDDSATVTLNVPDSADPEDPEGTGVIPYLDVLPIYATDLRLDINLRMSSKKNRLRRHYLRSDIEERRWREFTTKRLVLDPNTTMQVNLGGIQRGDFLFLESDMLIQVSVGNISNQFVPAQVLVLCDGDFEQVWIKNTSLTDSANVWIGAVD